MVGKQIATYEQHKLGLSAYYDKRWVLADGIHIEPNEFDMSRRQLCIWWSNQQLFAYKPTIGTILQIVNNRLVWFVYSLFKRADF